MSVSMAKELAVARGLSGGEGDGLFACHSHYCTLDLAFNIQSAITSVCEHPCKAFGPLKVATCSGLCSAGAHWLRVGEERGL